MSDKTCDKCGKPFKGFGETCSACRKAGLKSSGTQQACTGCGAFFSGFGDRCEDCVAAGIAGGAEGKKYDGDGIPIEDTNMAGVGGEEDKANRKKAAGFEPAWEGIGTEPGIWIFRIEAFKVVPWPKEKYGQFHEGDSYILLQTEHEIDSETGKPTEKLQHDIHFWLGKKTSTDEKGTAAYKTVELDDFFDGEPVQHRETQGNESDVFVSYFPEGISYLPGGVDSGFKVVQSDIFMNKLWQVRRTPKKAIIVEEEQCTRASLNHRDAFIVQSERSIYVWNGDSASPFVKNKANQKAEQMEAESNGELTVTHEIDAKFWEALGGEGDITAADAVGEEVAADFGEGVLYNIQVSDTDRSLSVKEVARGELDRSKLDSTGVMMVDTRTEIFLWLGKDCSKLEKSSAFLTASNYLKMNKRDVDKTAITILKEGHDTKSKTWIQMFPLKK